TAEGTYITVYPNGIKHSDATQTLNNRLEETFNMNVLSVDHQLAYTKYLLRNVNRQRMEVSNDNF
ncbi:cell division protein FtsK, partial [Lactobacillus iners]|nr:cell division protein FtsK [Lactobacillus mulieris]MCZ9655804.1 cell division protein FtsK [Lactobacillus iners]